ncbi:M20/M25/M40 family metallo-hydrolase [Hyphobacterium marinum]|uniref:M20/M25/M40 family metallo-hydrolase n=1 Tax=Hyphobacterium marinum TaxID=3116574 RepID=A0ABU7LXN0_9PROT|nr:M20/M25/M40 family metallo-hydrolase [Hyphobacterium sp. Y6023]MEE2566042.1 M20/M25/M40 family metallo-hydrolase [Hyphobacterium sp. Y6023]
MTRHRTTAALAAALHITAPAVGQVDAARDAAATYREANERAILTEAMDLLRLPNVAPNREDILANAHHIVGLMEARGIDARILEAGDAMPAVYGELFVPGATRTVMLYVHYDGQPVQPENWASDPFDPVLRAGRLEDEADIVDFDAADNFDPDWRIYARSASDDKTPLIAMLTAIDALRAAGLGPNVNIRFFLEGEEEYGSPHLRDLLETHRDLLDADIWLIADGPIDQRGDPRLILGVRGVTSMSLTIHGAERVLHSGHYGNVAPNPAARLAHLITSMRDENGRILIEDFHDGIAPIPEAAEQFIADGAFDEDSILAEPGIARTEYGPGAPYGEAVMVPALNVLGLSSGAVGDETRNAVPDRAEAAIGFRMVPGQTLEHLRAVVRDHIEAQGYLVLGREPTSEERLAHPMIAELHWSSSGYEAAGTPADAPEITYLHGLMTEASERPVRVVPLLGGSLPLAYIAGVTQTPFAIVPIVNPDNSQHAPNENIRLGNFWDGIELYAVLLNADWAFD